MKVPIIIYNCFFIMANWGVAIYPFVFFGNKKEDVRASHLRHELHHIKQVQRDGWIRFYSTYLYYNIKYGYDNNPYEIEARKAEKE